MAKAFALTGPLLLFGVGNARERFRRDLTAGTEPNTWPHYYALTGIEFRAEDVAASSMCAAPVAPLNGAYKGDCAGPDTLLSGHACTPTCLPGFVATGSTRCVAGSLVGTATCDAALPIAPPTPKPTAAPAVPTPSPTPYPTTLPTPSPTPSPVLNPTPYPTRMPTPSPTPSPVVNPTPYPTRMPTPAPTILTPPFQGAVTCGQTVTGNTMNPGADIITSELGGKDGYDHFYNFTLVQPTTVTFNGCDTTFDSVISVFDRLETDNAGAIIENPLPITRHGQVDDGCPNPGPSLLRVVALDAGDYSVVVEGYGAPDQGEYTMAMACQLNPTTAPPTQSPSPAPTLAPTARIPSFQGAVTCGQAVTGNTMVPGTDSITSELGGKDGYDHFYNFTLVQPTTVTFIGCDTTFDSVISVFDRLETDNAGAIENPLPITRHGQVDDGCPNPGPSLLRAVALDTGDYSVVVEGYGAGDQGEYTMVMACQLAPTTAGPTTAAPTSEPTTPGPTPAPTLVPTSAPATSGPTPAPIPAPTTAVPSQAPTEFVNYCPQGYYDYGTRYNAPLGKVTIATSHAACYSRCNQYSGPQFRGGCKGYQTGMYVGMLFCRSYGYNFRFTRCAFWAHPSHPGLYSGPLGSTHPRSTALNVGGNCCSNITFVEASIAAGF